jgi:hypothetical protein
LAIGTDPEEADVAMEDAEAMGFTRCKFYGEIPVQVDDPPAFQTDEMVMGFGMGIETPLSRFDGQLVDPPFFLEAPERRVNGRKRHRRKTGQESPVDLLRGGMVPIPLEIGDDGQFLGRPSRLLGGLGLLHDHLSVIIIY